MNDPSTYEGLLGPKKTPQEIAESVVGYHGDLNSRERSANVKKLQVLTLLLSYSLSFSLPYSYSYSYSPSLFLSLTLTLILTPPLFFSPLLLLPLSCSLPYS